MLASGCESKRGWTGNSEGEQRKAVSVWARRTPIERCGVEVQMPGLACGELDIVGVMDVSRAAGQLVRECGAAKSQRQEGTSSHEA